MTSNNLGPILNIALQDSCRDTKQSLRYIALLSGFSVELRKV